MRVRISNAAPDAREAVRSEEEADDELEDSAQDPQDLQKVADLITTKTFIFLQGIAFYQIDTASCCAFAEEALSLFEPSLILQKHCPLRIYAGGLKGSSATTWGPRGAEGQ